MVRKITFEDTVCLDGFDGGVFQGGTEGGM